MSVFFICFSYFLFLNDRNGLKCRNKGKKKSPWIPKTDKTNTQKGYNHKRWKGLCAKDSV